MASTEERDFSQIFNSQLCKRKLIRRQKKQLKIAQRVAAHPVKGGVAPGTAIDSEEEKRQRKREKRKRQRLRKKLKTSEVQNSDSDNDDEEEDEAFSENYTLEQFKIEAEEARRLRMADQMTEDDKEISRLEAKLQRSKKRRKKKVQTGSDDEHHDVDELERLLIKPSRIKNS